MPKHRLLLADDSVTIQKVVNLTFADEGIEVISVGDGNSAMEKFVEAIPDLVMVDVNMPGVDGYRICEMIKQDDETKHVPVILLVGSFEPFDEDEARRVGANDYLTKPFQSIRQLVNKVTVLLNKSNGSEVATAPPTQPPPVAETEMPDDAPVYQNIAPLQAVETPVLQTERQEIAEPPLGDAGMDDEMIQANQIGSLPVDDLQKLESTDDFEFGSLQNQLRNPSYEISGQQNAERFEDFGKTQPYSAEEFKELTSNSAEETDAASAQTSQSFNKERMSAEERAIFLENQMVSDFETEAGQTSTGYDFQENVTREFPQETAFTPPFERQETFTPEEIPAETPVSVEEIPQQQDFVVEELPPQQRADYPADEAADYYDTSSGQSDAVLEDLYDAPEDDAETADSIGSEFYSKPEPVNAQTIADSFISTESFEVVNPEEDKTDFSAAQEFQAETSVEDQAAFPAAVNYQEPEIVEEETPAVNFSNPETVSGQPTYFEDRETSFEPQVNVENEEFVEEEGQFSGSSETLPVEERSFVEDRETANLQETSGGQQYSAEPETDHPKSLTFSEPETYFSQQNEAVETESAYTPAEREITEEDAAATPTIEIPAPFPTIEEEIYIPQQEAEKEEAAEVPAQEFTAAEEDLSPFEETAVEAELAAEEAFSKEIIEEQPVKAQEIQAEPEARVEPVEETPKIEETPKTEEAPTKAETAAEPQFNTLVSNKEKSEAVESVIVSEFARHSISLSSEAVETIASRIADKISEKIVQQMANDVVGNLADLIVERMERKKLE